MPASTHPRAPSYVGPSFADAKVCDAMRVGVVTCRPETKLSDVARMMVGYEMHAVVVSNADGHGAYGIVTSLDLARRADEIQTLTAGDVASTPLVTVPSNERLERAARLMADRGISHLVAVDRDTGRPVGMISTRGIAAVLAYGR